jgi:hypothetical protein
MGFKEDYERRVREVQEAEASALESKAWWQFVEKMGGQVLSNEANRNVAKEMLEQISTPFTLENLVSTLEQDPSFRQALATQTPEQSRAASLETIQKITGSVPVTAKWQTNDQLAQKANELEQRRELSSKSPSELRAIIQAGRPAPDALPPLAADVTRAVLLNMPPAELKATCGVSAI